jgi:RHH-type proline utilization regulon transcriptional repressor/proline dehydrogenase/delta 1-pyrroline-5-carboxylate dehydrogenase
VDELAGRLGRKFMVRLVKGAYWDTEVKRAQERGLADYPVFTRKAATDQSYLACARLLLAARPRIYPQFATHNALTVATILEMAGGADGFEFQRLHGMGEALYDALIESDARIACRIYAAIANCWPISSDVCWRTAPTRPSCPSSATRTCRWRAC